MELWEFTTSCHEHGEWLIWHFLFGKKNGEERRDPGFSDFGKGKYPLFAWRSRMADRWMFWPVVSCVFVGVVFVFHTVHGSEIPNNHRLDVIKPM